jgi:ribosomal protein S18 acetylase RimI-like enzyme
MSIKSIDETMWAGILRVQAEVYFQVEPESLDILQGKWHHSPDCCFVYQQGQDVLAYLLAHAWHSELPPKLYQPLANESKGAILFLHDLAVSKQLSGQGIGSQLVNHLLNAISTMGFEQIRLVAIQESLPFWRKMGFSEVAKQIPCSSYGKDASLMQRLLPISKPVTNAP